MTVLATFKQIPFEPQVNRLFKTFIVKSAVIMNRKSVILAYIHKIIGLQRKIKERLEMNKLKKRAVYERLNQYIDYLKGKEIEQATKNKKKT